jgi:hypothetical protein
LQGSRPATNEFRRIYRILAAVNNTHLERDTCADDIDSRVEGPISRGEPLRATDVKVRSER